MKEKVIYYQDELKDEFSGDNIKPKLIDDKYIYVHKSIIKKITHIFWYRIIAIPLATLFLKIKYRHKLINKRIIKKYGKNGFFLYGNHTNNLADAFIPTMISLPKRALVIVHPNNISMPILGKINPSLGALPLPDSKGAYCNFKEAISHHMSKKRSITIYPEAHIWPFYTKIRPFKSDSFRFPVEYQKPVFCFTNTYQKRRFSKNPRIVTYIDGPFYGEDNLSLMENKEKLRNLVYQTMVTKSNESNIEIIKYIKKESNND